jgi:allantoinase
MRLVVRHGTVVTPHGRLEADVLCADGRVEALLAPRAFAEAEEEVDAKGCLIFPGFIDPHVHSRDPGQTDKEDLAHSSRAAACGGVTTICEMPNSLPPVTSAAEYEARAAFHAPKAFVDFALWGLALGSQNLNDLAGLVEAGAVGVKLFWGYALNRQTMQLVYNLDDLPAAEVIPPPDNREVFELFQEMARCGGLLAAHCEDRGILEAAQARLGRQPSSYDDLLLARPALAEQLALAMAVELAQATGCRFHAVHMSSRGSVINAREAQARGVRISSETCPQYLTLTRADYARIGAAMKVFPPVRDHADQEALWEGIRDGTICSVGSDHAPHTLEQKRLPLAAQPAGAVGVETLGPIMIDAMLNGRLTAERLAEVLSEGTSRLYGLYPQKGALLPGSDADLTVVDPDRESTVLNEQLHSKQPLSPWHGCKLKGRIRFTVLRGHVIMRDGDLIGAPTGELVRTQRRATPTLQPIQPVSGS